MHHEDEEPLDDDEEDIEQMKKGCELFDQCVEYLLIQNMDALDDQAEEKGVYSAETLSKGNNQ